MELIKRDYWWPGMRKDVDQYIDNCYACQRSKARRDKYNGLLQPSAISDQRWQEVAMDFITGLPLSKSTTADKEYNAKMTVIDKLPKERHYIPCYWGNEGTSSDTAARL